MIEKYIKLLFLLCSVIAFIPITTYARISTAFGIDPFPVFDARNPHLFLLDREKEYYRGGFFEQINDHGRIAISVFGQVADRGRTLSGGDFQEPPQSIEVPLGDIRGRTGMIPLVFGPAPQGTTLEQVSPTLQAAKTALFGDVLVNGNIDDSAYIDPAQELGYFSFDMRYRKYGVRLVGEALIAGDFGINLSTTVCAIKQPLRDTKDFTKEADDSAEKGNVTKENVEEFLMKKEGDILEELMLDITQDCPETSIEEIRLGLFWRHACELNPEDESWPHVLIIPFIEANGSASPGKKMSPNIVFGVPFGNNQHAAVGFSAGLCFDFLECIELAGEVGYTHFFSHDFDNVPIPNSEFQTNIYPFRTNVSIRPGANWHFTGVIAAHHFLERLSMYFEYCMVEHKEDSIKLKECDPASVFKPEVLEDRSCFKSKKINVGFTYDISPNISLGFVWQMPLSERGSYKSSTILFSFNALL